MQELISVIVPVYNVAPYLERCVQSIVNQTYTNLEIILVDDGATDESGKLCDQWAERDTRIRVIHQKNAGLSGARNTGLLSANGQYVVFWDSDDWTEVSILHTAYQTMKKTEADIVVWGYSVDFVNKKGQQKHSTFVQLPEAEIHKGCSSPLLLSPGILGAVGYAWNKLYRKQMLIENQIFFEKGISLVEDILFNSTVFCKAKEVVFMTAIGTHYMQRARPTLGVAYYPNAFQLKCRAAEAKLTILNTYGIERDIANAYMQHQLVGALCSTIRMIARTYSLSKKARIESIRELLHNQSALTCLNQNYTRGCKDRLFVWLCRHEFVRILLWYFR